MAERPDEKASYPQVLFRTTKRCSTKRANEALKCGPFTRDRGRYVRPRIMADAAAHKETLAQFGTLVTPL